MRRCIALMARHSHLIEYISKEFRSTTLRCRGNSPSPFSPLPSSLCCSSLTRPVATDIQASLGIPRSNEPATVLPLGTEARLHEKSAPSSLPLLDSHRLQIWSLCFPLKVQRLGTACQGGVLCLLIPLSPALHSALALPTLLCLTCLTFVANSSWLSARRTILLCPGPQTFRRRLESRGPTMLPSSVNVGLVR